ncbi:16S rRNA processing protein RimM [Rhodoligotrophos appendicifer]|uniref:ribosome maturation factor RimM n=1 Tax=Rhodoligotrophos appendicifer TaxID=987056 RepID=UPI001186130E|nr:ribosome maturation factor RimM [Rhodoligotrophos appendicifer]
MQSQPKRVCLGVVTGAHGVKGEVKIKSFTEHPEAIGGYGPLETEDGAKSFTIERARVVTNGVVAAISGIRDRDAAEALRGTLLHVARSCLPEPDEDEFYLADLIGLEAIDVKGEPAGRVVAVENFGAGDLLEVRLEGSPSTVYVPFTKDAVPEVDLAAGRVVVVLDGLE